MPQRRPSPRPLAVAAFSAVLAAACAPSPAAPRTDAPVYSYKVVARYPHDSLAFTQGLIWKDGHLYESTGLNGRSSLRKVKLENGQVLQRRDLPAEVFGEGLTDRGEQLLMLTWTNGSGYVFNRGDFSPAGTFAYAGEGWGLTRSADTVYMSDGSAQLRLLDPATLRERSRIRVTDNGRAVDQLNELEWVKGEIYANVWQTDLIARIDPKTGHVRGWIDLSGLLQGHGTSVRGSDVLNGIAYDAKGDRLFVTGKLWPNLFQIELVPPAKPAPRR
ncbi:MULTISPECIES: glutaminyl-peptide cyclotransferase [Lysobacter]|uniref:Glutaminyl-peptide cyclotransferase n=1 Tax=Lysobacter yananisis TaxID=1003114 RepID=A0ABY9P6Z0_9GAMM|nr:MULTISPECIES: glutaminyl-peptide cyclotransferase [Lysobacter]QQP99654.1 glutaminyl-peptide cyclotransferase [Lysobacter enzymogenes]WMT02823.1 glutaminyl-peptide cyclotransferase [Lysobacter yananisis]